MQSNASYSNTKSGIQNEHLCPIVALMCKAHRHTLVACACMGTAPTDEC